MQSTVETPMFLGRQPILDAAQSVIGYELLFHAPGQDEAVEATTPAAATAQTVVSSFSDLGIADALRHLKAFIPVDKEFLAADTIQTLPPEQVVLAVAATLADSALARCKELVALGYPFCVDINPSALDTSGPMLDVARYIRIDIAAAAPDVVAKAVAKLHGHAHKLLATRVETEEQRTQCEELGFSFFQGYYFAKPLLDEEKQLDPTTQGLLRLINLVSSDVETHEIAEAFKIDPALTMSLLRVVNSAAMGLRSPVGSITHAVSMLGRRQLSRWLHLLLFRGGGGTLANNPLMLHAAMRGRMMEMLIERTTPGDRAALESAFMVGVMSLMPAALRMPMAKVLEQISLAPAVRAAVADYEGPLGQLLLLIEYYDDGNEVGCTLTMQRIGSIDQHMLNNCVVQTLLWVQGLEA